MFGDRWLSNRHILKERDANFFNPFHWVFDLFVASDKVWNVEALNDWFPAPMVDQIIQTPLFSSIEEDQRFWWPEQSGVYSVCSAYNLLMNDVLDSDNLHADGNLRALWKLKIPPKVKHFLWRFCRDILPTRSKLRFRHIDVQDSCPWCASGSESTMHLFIY